MFDPGLKHPHSSMFRISLIVLKLLNVILFSDWYEHTAAMMGEEGAVIGGLLVGLNVIDCNICIKGGDLDVQVGRGNVLVSVGTSGQHVDFYLAGF